MPSNSAILKQIEICFDNADKQLNYEATQAKIRDLDPSMKGCLLTALQCHNEEKVIQIIEE